MGIKLNPLTGQFDLTGSAGGSGASFSDTFNSTTDWSGPLGGFYTITYSQSLHGKGDSPTVQIFELESGNYNEVDVDRVQINSSGDVEIRVQSIPDLRFAGKIVIGN